MASVQKLKKSLRQVKRLLEKRSDRLSSLELLDLQRQQRSLENQIELHQVEEEERKHWLKYKLVRFFELKKSQRRLKKAEKADDEQELICAIVQMLYVRCHPKDSRPYISIFVNHNNQQASKANADSDDGSSALKLTAAELDMILMKEDKNTIYLRIREHVMDLLEATNDEGKSRQETLKKWSKNLPALEQNLTSALFPRRKAAEEPDHKVLNQDEQEQKEDDFFCQS